MTSPDVINLQSQNEPSEKNLRNSRDWQSAAEVPASAGEDNMHISSWEHIPATVPSLTLLALSVSQPPFHKKTAEQQLLFRCCWRWWRWSRCSWTDSSSSSSTCDQWQPPDLLVLQAVPDLPRGGQGSSGMSSLRDLRKAVCRTFNGAEQSYSAFLPHSSRLFLTYAGESISDHLTSSSLIISTKV